MAEDAKDTCSGCHTKFAPSATPVSANPRARSRLLGDLCQRCAVTTLAAADPPVTFAEMLALAWQIPEPPR